MPPFAAQGANQGLEDAAVIATAIANIVDRNALNDRAVIHSSFSTSTLSLLLYCVGLA